MNCNHDLPCDCGGPELAAVTVLADRMRRDHVASATGGTPLAWRHLNRPEQIMWIDQARAAAKEGPAA